MEYAAAQSTMCRQCGGNFSPFAHRHGQIKVQPAPETQPSAATEAHHPSLRQRWQNLWGKKGTSTVECFECNAKQEVISAAASTICPKCSAHLDLRDYKITTNFGRAIRTHGEVHVAVKGDLSSSQVVCRSALIEGKVRGDLHCAGTARVNFSGKVPGRISANHVLIERKSVVQFFRRVRVKSIEIRGHMTGEVIAESVVTIRRSASLDGNVTAKSISVEKGGVFSGQLMIGSISLTQAELLPTQNPGGATASEPGGVASPLVRPPLPAT